MRSLRDRGAASLRPEGMDHVLVVRAQIQFAQTDGIEARISAPPETFQYDMKKLKLRQQQGQREQDGDGPVAKGHHLWAASCGHLTPRCVGGARAPRGQGAGHTGR